MRGNQLHDAPHLAVYLHGNDHHIVDNSIQRVMQETGDGGAIYLGRHFTETGHVIERNVIIGATERSVHLDARGMSFAAPHLQPGGTLVEMLAKVPYQSEAWSAPPVSHASMRSSSSNASP